MYHVYILRSSICPDQIYKGFTTDIRDRLQRQNRGEIKHTSKHKPWKLIFLASFTSQGKATRFEQYLKSGSGTAFAHKRLTSF